MPWALKIFPTTSAEATTASISKALIVVRLKAAAKSASAFLSLDVKLP